MCVCICVCLWLFVCTYSDEKTQSFPRTFLFVEIDICKRFGFKTFIRACKLLNETINANKINTNKNVLGRPCAFSSRHIFMLSNLFPFFT